MWTGLGMLREYKKKKSVIKVWESRKRAQHLYQSSGFLFLRHLHGPLYMSSLQWAWLNQPKLFGLAVTCLTVPCLGIHSWPELQPVIQPHWERRPWLLGQLQLMNSSLVLLVPARGPRLVCVSYLPRKSLSYEPQWSDKTLLRKTPHSLVRRSVRLKLVLTMKLPPWWLGVYAGCPGRKANNSLIQLWTLKATMTRSDKICLWVGVIVAQMIWRNQLLLIGSMTHSAGENSYLVL